MACCGDVPTLETLAAVDMLREHLPELKIRVVNVVDLMTLQPPSEHPHGLSDRDFDALFTTDKPIIFAFHGYPWLIHRLTYRRTNHANLHVRGYKEEGTTTTPFDMVVLNDLDRFHLVDGRDRPRAAAWRARRLRQAGPARQADRAQAIHPPLRRRYAGDPRLEMAILTHLLPPLPRGGRGGVRTSTPCRRSLSLSSFAPRKNVLSRSERRQTATLRPVNRPAPLPSNGLISIGPTHTPKLPCSAAFVPLQTRVTSPLK